MSSTAFFSRLFSMGVSAISAVLLVAACGTPVPVVSVNTFKANGEDLFMAPEDFPCLRDAGWDVVGKSRFYNFFGHRDEMLAVAKGEKAGPYPVGTVVQEFPTEAMVKRGQGFSPETGDWEFFVFDNSTGKTIVTQRGTTEVSNPAGTCASCHGKAKPEFDFVCSTGHGCADLPFFIEWMRESSINNDPRCPKR